MVNINFKDYNNPTEMEALFAATLEELNRKNMLTTEDNTALVLTLYAIDNFFSRIKERQQFFNTDYPQMLDNKIKVLNKRIKKSEALLKTCENESTKAGLIASIATSEERLEHYKLQKKYKTIKITADGDVISFSVFNVEAVVKGVVEILRSNGLTRPARLYLEKSFIFTAKDETMASILERAIQNENKLTTN